MRDTMKRRVELADFLKTRRARLRPEQFDLPIFNNRRTPGLRREELAQLAGVGVSCILVIASVVSLASSKIPMRSRSER